MIRPLLTLSLAMFFATVATASDVSMPPKNPKAQATRPPAPSPSGEYGDAKFSTKDVKAVVPVATEGEATIKTTVTEVCPKKGCWMKVQSGTPGEQLRVTFKDYGFFVPTELVGKEVALQGRYVKHVESVEEQKHLLQDSKRPQAEIDAVTKPKVTLRFIANGVKDLSTESK